MHTTPKEGPCIISIAIPDVVHMWKKTYQYSIYKEKKALANLNKKRKGKNNVQHMHSLQNSDEHSVLLFWFGKMCKL